MKYACEMIRDLLPLYHDEICSDASREIVEEHLKECSDCKAYYEKLCDSDEIENEFYDKETELKIAKSFKDFSKKVMAKSVGLGLIIMTLISLVCLVFIYLDVDLRFNKEVYKDVACYEENREEFFTDEMNEIWPESIMGVEQPAKYKLISYYDDATAYTGYLKVTYDEASYEKEVERLHQVESTDYIGKYGITGFEQQLLAIKAYEPSERISRGYRGITYALVAGSNEIIYCTIQFPRELPRKDWKKYIPDEFTPLGLSFGYVEYFTKDQLVWGVGLIMIGCWFCNIAHKNIGAKKKRGYLQMAFFVILLVMGVLILTA